MTASMSLYASGFSSASPRRELPRTRMPACSRPVAVECVLVTRSCGVPLRGLGFGLSAPGLTVGEVFWGLRLAPDDPASAPWPVPTDLVGPGTDGARGPDWATTGVIRPVTEIATRVFVAVDEFAGLRTYQQLVDASVADQPAQGAVRLRCSRGGSGWTGTNGPPPSARRPIAGGLVGQHRPDQTHRGIRNGTPVGTPSHAAFHGRQIEVFDHDVAIGARQLPW